MGEYEVKAAFLYNFAKFVEWPSEAFPTPTSPIVIGVLTNEEVASALERTVAGKTAQGRPVEIRRLQQVSEAILHCHVVFVGSSEGGMVRDLLKLVKGRPVFTVGDAEGFGQRGGMLNFVISENKVRFEVNNLSAKSGGLRISAKLLQLATNVWE